MLRESNKMRGEVFRDLLNYEWKNPTSYKDRKRDRNAAISKL